MPVYEYRCDYPCGSRKDVIAPMLADHTPPTCEACGMRMRRLYSSAFHCDEIRGTTYFHPKHKMQVRDHGKYFDIGLGKWIKGSKKERYKEMAKQGAIEYGPRMV